MLVALVFCHRLCHIERDERVETVGLKRREARAALRDNQIAEAVEIGAAREEVVGVPFELYHLAAEILLFLEWPSPDAALPQIGDRNVRG